MKIGFYSPYLDGLSGGERYVLALAGHWSRVHRVDVFWNDSAILARARDRLRLDLRKVYVVPNVFQRGNMLEKLLVTRSYDLIFFLSDGSVPMSLAGHNILHFQVPFGSVSINPWKFRKYDAIVCNSNFTKNNLDPALQSKATVIYPPVITNVARLSKKEKIILTVGRFHPDKKQNVLVEVFKKIAKKKEFAGWKLVCIGGLLPADTSYFTSLEKASHGYPITFIANGDFDGLQMLYRKASLYWHAAGYGESDPKLQEHFGISTVEAMAYGCIPVVYNGGGLVEIIKEGISGFLWNTQGELIQHTTKITQNPSLSTALAQRAVERSHDFDETRFCNAFDELLTQITQ